MTNNIIENLIKEYKDKNGGAINYTMKELLAALHTKINVLEIKFDEYIVRTDEIAKHVARTTAKSDKKIGVLEAYVAILTLLFVGMFLRLFVLV